jgi:ATP-binding cassette subfamily F protein 3
MSLLSLRAVVIRVGGRTLIDGADLTLPPGRRLGLVGRNGAGKTTLLRAIAGELAIDGGEISLPSRARLGQVRQEAPEGKQSLRDVVLAADPERLALLTEQETAPAERQAEIAERLRAIAADSAPARAAAILAGLGFDTEAQARPVDSYSGGWRMRVALAAALFAAPDLLLLDEPTNHLDLEATLWLESWLAHFAGAAIIVSHDRGLLQRAVHAIAHLEDGHISVTAGGFDAFVRIRTERAAQQQAVAARIAARRAELQAFVDRFRYQASKARQAQARLKALAKLPPLQAVVAPAPTRFAFPEPRPIPPPMLVLEHAAVGYDGTPVLAKLSLRLDGDDRIALLGANGNGKSTFARLLAGRLQPLAGAVRRAPGLRVGYFAQHQAEELIAAESPLTHLARVTPQARGEVLRAQLARFGLDADRADTPSGALSGGEKARLLLALATAEAPHLLVLDEPSNHLDIDAREALVEALAEFPGAVVLITHDPHLVRLVADRLWLVAGGTVRPFDGDLDDYRQVVAEAAKAGEKPATGQSRRDDRRERAEARLALAPLRRRALAAEARLDALARERARLEARLADPGLYVPERAGEVTAAQTRLAAVTKATRVAEHEWLAAEEALEAAQA